MALCGLCLTVPFSSLPRAPMHTNFHMIFGQNMIVLHYDDNETAIDTLGFAWHENLSALAASAKFCPLCELVQKGVASWLDSYQNALSNPSFKEFNHWETPMPAREQLWLAQRFGGAAGFVVLVRNHLARRAHLLTSISFSVEACSPWSQRFPLRSIDWDSGSSGCLKVAESWLSDCINNHKECEEGGSTLPSRVLDIGFSGEIITLVDGVGRSGKYACLSYCWGQAQPCTTNRANIKSRLSGIHLSELPSTLRDAVIIARHLGLQYLWIDSLCICQDDAEEWGRESARMVDVYSSAHIVIAANHAKDSSVGCFHIREQRPMATITSLGLDEGKERNVTVQALLLFPHGEIDWAGGEFHSEPLTKRGWALQEHVLAKRLLHYNTREMHFECNDGIIGESGSRSKRRYCSLDRGRASTLKRASHETWNSLLWAYGERKLTKATDKMPALSGIASLFQQRLGAEYVAGLWSDDLVDGLAWQGHGFGKLVSAPSSIYAGPSWSWATFDGVAATGVRHLGFKDIAEIKDWFVKTDTNPYGEIKDAWIRIRAPMTNLIHSPVEIIDHEIRLGRAGIQPLPRMCTQYTGDKAGHMVTLDSREASNSGEWRSWDLDILMLGGYPNEHTEETGRELSGGEEGENISHSYCLVVRKVDNREGTERVERMGWMFLDNEATVKVKESEENWKTVMLI